MNSNKESRSGNSPTIVAKKPNREFENIDLLQHLMGDSKRETSGRSDIPSEQSSCLRNSTDGVLTPNAHNSQIQSPTPSLESDHNELVEQPLSISTAPLPYRASSLPKMIVSGSVSPECQIDLPDHSDKSLVVLRSSSSPSSHAATPQIGRPHTRPVSEPNPGLNALFQQPLRLKSYSTSDHTGLVPLQATTSGSSSGSPSLLDSLSATSSMTSLRSQMSELGAYSESSRTESQTSQYSTAQHRPVLASYSSDPGIKAEQYIKGKTSRVLPVTEPRNQRIALSYLSAYYARVADQPAHVIEPVPSGSGSGGLPNFEGTTPKASQLIGVTVERTRSGSPSSTTTDLDSLASAEDALAAFPPPDAGLMIVTPEIASRRDEADSQAWQRKTKMLQLD